MKPLLVIFSLLMICILGAAPAEAVKHSKFAIGGEVSGYCNSDESTEISNRYRLPSRSFKEPDVKIRFRFFLGSKIGLDLGVGYLYLSSVNYDSETDTESQLGSGVLSAEIGALIKVADGEKSYLGLIGRFGLTAHAWSDYFYEERIFEYYTVFAPSIFLGIEPAYFFTPRFSIYSTLGLRIKFIPESQQLTRDRVQDGWTDWYWEKRKDSKTLAKFDGIMIGVMYFL